MNDVDKLDKKCPPGQPVGRVFRKVKMALNQTPINSTVQSAGVS